MISSVDRWHSLSLATHLAIGDCGDDLIQFGRNIDFHVIRISDVSRYVSELVVDSFQRTREESM